jgi:phosphoglycolate phosphatase
MIEAIFLDFNGVIINDEPLQLKAYQEALGKQEILLSEGEYYQALGMDDETFVRTMFKRAGKRLSEKVMQSIIARKAELHRGHIEKELPLFPGVVTFIKAAARAYGLGVVSMARRTEVDYALKRARLADLFLVVVSAEDVTACKPDPSCYQHALGSLNRKRRIERRLPLLAKECLVIEDAPPGIQAARAAGMRTIGVTNTVPESALRSAGAEVVTPNLADWGIDAVHHLFD